MIPLLVIGSLILFGVFKRNAGSEVYNFTDANADYLKNSILLFLGSLLYLRAIYKDIRQYIKTKSIWSFLPTLFGIVFLTFLMWQSNQQEDKKGLILQAATQGGPGIAAIRLYNDSSFRYSNGCAGIEDVFNGKYQLHDSILVLDKSQFDGFLKSKYLLIHKTGKEYFICQTDSLLQILNSEKFLIVFDLRKVR